MFQEPLFGALLDLLIGMIFELAYCVDGDAEVDMSVLRLHLNQSGDFVDKTAEIEKRSWGG